MLKVEAGVCMVVGHPEVGDLLGVLECSVSVYFEALVLHLQHLRSCCQIHPEKPTWKQEKQLQKRCLNLNGVTQIKFEA